MPSIRVSRLLTLSAVVLLVSMTASTAQAAEPPDLINYQGVLRNAENEPLEGSFNVAFQFWSADLAGEQILIDEHAGLAVSGGLFNVALGTGTITDGSGAGTYLSLRDVFRDYEPVFIEIWVNGERLEPRLQVLAAAYALNAQHLGGQGQEFFLNTGDYVQTKSGPLIVDSTGQILTAFYVIGEGEGGYFSNASGDGSAFISIGDTGIYATGSAGAGSFQDTNDSGRALVAVGDRGIEALGHGAGGYFSNTAVAGEGEAYLAQVDAGIRASGSAFGGRFDDSDGSGYARVGVGDRGIEGFGSNSGGYFASTDGYSETWVAYGTDGIVAHGDIRGGFFDATGYSGYAWIADQDDGIRAYGNYAGGYFEDLNSGNYSYVGHDTYKALGTGTPSFVQNHPEDSTRVIVYAAPEGDEVATYTRGTARLVGGEARVDLGETFRWVTNPDVGLTAHLTPRGDCAGLFVESLTTEELIVREVNGGTGDVVFDYLVFGLRIGFEEVGIVQEKEREAYIPSMARHRERYEKHPELRDFSALQRFRTMRAKIGVAEPLDLEGARALRAAIVEFDPDVHRVADGPEFREASRPRSPDETPPDVGTEADVLPMAPLAEMDEDVPLPGRSFRPAARYLATMVDVGEPVEPGDVLALDPDRPHRFVRASDAADPTVLGVVAGDAEFAPGSEVGDGRAAVAVTGLVVCKVDAGYGEIRPGDLLTTSPTPGYAMRADDPRPGIVLGKAMEALETGTGSIRVLVTVR